MYNKLLGIYQEKGHCKVSASLGEENNSLNNWCVDQRKKFFYGKLSEEREYKLNQIKFDFNPVDKAWNDKFKLLESKMKESGGSYAPKRGSSDGLSRWVQSQRRNYRYKLEGKKNILTDERESMLLGIGFEFVVGSKKEWADDVRSNKDNKPIQRT